MLSFKPKTDEVLNHWIAFAENLALPPQEFYKSVEKELAISKIPGLETSRLQYREGGLLSDERVYLRMIRERLAFDICAAPFGQRFFFSCRTVYSPAVVQLWHILAVIMFFIFIFYPLYLYLDFTLAVIALLGIMVALTFTLKNTIAMGLADLDTLFLKTPALGPIYERWFRSSDTYYREDTRLLYLDAIPNLVKKLTEEVTAEKGVRLVRQYEKAPVLGELYRPVAPVPTSKEKE